MTFQPTHIFNPTSKNHLIGTLFTSLDRVVHRGFIHSPFAFSVSQKILTTIPFLSFPLHDPRLLLPLPLLVRHPFFLHEPYE